MSGRVIAVTGAFGALGQAVARAAAASGASVVAVDAGATAPPDYLDPAQHEIAAGTNLLDAAVTKAAMDKAAARFGRVDALINIAGGFRWEPIAEGAPETWDQMYAINVKTALNAVHAALPHLIASGVGRIVNIGANGALKSGAGMGPYAASKAGVHRLTESLAEELKAKNVTVNAVLPSIIDTPVNRKDMPDADFTKWVSPQALAAVILFLASEAGAPITGALIPVTGRV